MEDTPMILLRALIIYAGGLILIRISEKRFLGRESPFDLLLSFILGSTLSRGINGSSSIADALAASALLLILHAVLGLLTYYSPSISKIIKGRVDLLIKDGMVQEDSMRKHTLTQGDLLESLRLKGKLTEPDQAKLAFFERNGSISIIPEKKPPQIIEVAVAAGVQTVRLKIE